MEIRELPLHDIILDPNLNLRDRLDQDTVDRYVEAWNRMPPVTIFEVDGNYLLADGFHRHAAAVVLNRRAIPAEVIKGTFEEAMDFVAGANLHHGLPLTRAERRRAIEVKLRLHHERSDRHLAEELSVGRELVAKVRKQLVDSGQIEAGEKRIGADGKSYPAIGLPKDPNERLPRGGPQASGGPLAGCAPWEDANDPLPTLPPAEQGRDQPRKPGRGASAPWEDAAPSAERPDAKALALAPPIPPSAPTIDEMLALMTRQIIEVVHWTNADGFVEAYRTARANNRGLFQTAAIKLAARADQLRKVS
jgi:hypothetical protein